MSVNPLAGKTPRPEMLVDLPRLLAAYYEEKPDPAVRQERVAFGTSGHRGSSLTRSFNEAHILAVTQAIADYRARQGIGGPLFLGIDTHALSRPAFETALEVLAGNGVEVMIAAGEDYTPTPAVSHAILGYNKGRESGLADGIVITPSHNPPEDGGFKYNPPHGGPAETAVTRAIEARANELLAAGPQEVKKVPFETALRAATTHRYDYCGAYVRDLGSLLDLESIRGSGLKLGVDPLGGAGVHYWARIAEEFGLDLSVVDERIDPTFAFMSLDWDGKIRMDPSSPHAMRRLIALKDRFDIALACDTDHDRHGIVTKSAGLLPPNHYLSVAVFYLFRHRPHWGADAAVGKTVATSTMLDRIAARLGRTVCEVPVGFKWFVEGLLSGALAFAGEESAGASFGRREGGVWTTDKDGIAPALLAAEITARLKRDPGEIYRELEREFGQSSYIRIDAPATPAQKEALGRLAPQDVPVSELAGEKITRLLTEAPGNGAPIGGLKVVAENGWFLARPSGTENVTKIYAESFRGEEALRRIVAEAEETVRSAVTAA